MLIIPSPTSPRLMNSFPMKPPATRPKDPKKRTVADIIVIVLCLMALKRIPRIISENLCRPLSNFLITNPQTVLESKISSLENLEVKRGITVSAAKVLMVTDITITIAKGAIIGVIMLCERATGRNTTIRTSDVEITVIFTSLTPSKVACHAFLPISRCLYTFSRTTIASSTKVPIIRERASNVIKLRV